METTLNAGLDTRFRAGWWLLLGAATLMTLNHVVMIFALDEPTLFVGYAAFSVYSLVTLAIPFRRHEGWAWVATWILPVGLALAAYTAPDVAILYYAFAAVCVLGLLLTRSQF